MRWIVPPLPAVSRPSNRTSTRSLLARAHDCIFTNSICSASSSLSYSLRAIFSGIGRIG